MQEPDAGIVAPESATLVPLFAAVTVPPVHVVAPAGVAVFTRPAGYVSVKAAAVIAVVFEFVSVIVRTDAVPGVTVDGVNDFVAAGCASTVRLADALAAVPAFVVVTVPVVLL